MINWYTPPMMVDKINPRLDPYPLNNPNSVIYFDLNKAFDKQSLNKTWQEYKKRNIES